MDEQQPILTPATENTLHSFVKFTILFSIAMMIIMVIIGFVVVNLFGIKQKDYSDNRVLLTRDNIDKTLFYDGVYHLDEEFNYSAKPDSVVIYSNEKWGISFDIPYNINWGNEKYKISPYEDYLDQATSTYTPERASIAELQFGPLFKDRYQSMYREYRLRILPQVLASEFIDQLEQEISKTDLSYSKPIISDANGLQIIKYTKSSLSGDTGISYSVVIGKKYNYEFSVIFGYPGIDTSFESVLKSIKLLDNKEIVDNRILLTKENMGKIANADPIDDNPGPACTERFREDSSNSITGYYSQKWGLSMDIPYNINWGNEKYRLNPYEEYLIKEEGPTLLGQKYIAEIVYGYLAHSDGCYWTRTSYLYILDKQTASDVVNQVNKIIDDPRYKYHEFTTPIVEHVNGLEVVKYKGKSAYGDDYQAFVIIGKKYNYEFLSNRQNSSDNEKVLKTIKLID